MDTPIRPLLPAFQLLWKAAKAERGKYNINDCVNGNFGKPKQNNNTNGNVGKSSPATDKILSNGDLHQSSSDSSLEDGNLTDCDERVVVCTMECDHGDKFVRQIIHDGTTKSVWSRAEDLFLDWLNSDLTSQHAQRIDVTIYFCRVPVSTSCDGLCLWVKNLRDEGKEVNIKIKVASLGYSFSRALRGLSKSPQMKGKLDEGNEAEEIIEAVRRLVKMGAVIEPVSGGDWMHLISLLTDRVSLQALDLKRSPCSEILSTLLDDTFNIVDSRNI